jgi:hypothetical protein
MIIGGRKIQVIKRIISRISKISIRRRPNKITKPLTSKPTIRIIVFTIKVSKNAPISKPPRYASPCLCHGDKRVLESTGMEKK